MALVFLAYICDITAYVLGSLLQLYTDIGDMWCHFLRKIRSKLSIKPLHSDRLYISLKPRYPTFFFLHLGMVRLKGYPLPNFSEYTGRFVMPKVPVSRSYLRMFVILLCPVLICTSIYRVGSAFIHNERLQIAFVEGAHPSPYQQGFPMNEMDLAFFSS